jgi:hypothetical protein
MTTTCTLDPTTGTSPVRRASSLLEPKIAANSQRSMSTFVKIFLVSGAAATVALLSTLIENPGTNDGRCTVIANPQNSLVRPNLSPLLRERARLTAALPILSVPTGTGTIATVDCDHGLHNRNFGSQIDY